MKEHGITVLRFSVQEIDTNMCGVVETIRNEIWLLRNRTGLSGDEP